MDGFAFSAYTDRKKRREQKVQSYEKPLRILTPEADTADRLSQGTAHRVLAEMRFGGVLKKEAMLEALKCQVLATQVQV